MFVLTSRCLKSVNFFRYEYILQFATVLTLLVVSTSIFTIDLLVLTVIWVGKPYSNPGLPLMQEIFVIPYSSSLQTVLSPHLNSMFVELLVNSKACPGHGWQGIFRLLSQDSHSCWKVRGGINNKCMHFRPSSLLCKAEEQDQVWQGMLFSTEY